MVKNSNKFIKQIVGKGKNRDKEIIEIHNILKRMCVEMYDFYKQLYNRMRSIGINKNNNNGSKQNYNTAMFYKAILDKDRNRFEKFYKEIKDTSFKLLDQSEHYADEDKCLYMFDRDEGATKIEDEGTYIKYCNAVKKNIDDIEKTHRMVLMTPNWF